MRSGISRRCGILEKSFRSIKLPSAVSDMDSPHSDSGRSPGIAGNGWWTQGNQRRSLLNLDLGALLFQLLLDGLGLFLGHASLDRLGCTLNQILRFFQTQVGHLAHNL